MRLTAVLGNIVKQPDCDAIVNSANQNMRAGSGVCGAIYKAAGPALEPYSSKLAPLGLGEAVLTPGFNLPNRYVIHTRGPKYFFDDAPPDNLSKAMRNTLLLAEEHHLPRVAVPAISMGVFAYPPAEAVPILVRTALETGGALSHVEEVRFVVMDSDLFERFAKEIERNS